MLKSKPCNGNTGHGAEGQLLPKLSSSFALSSEQITGTPFCKDQGSLRCKIKDPRNNF